MVVVGEVEYVRNKMSLESESALIEERGKDGVVYIYADDFQSLWHSCTHV